MRKRSRLVLLAALVATALMPLSAQVPPSASADIQLQLGDLLAGDARFRDAIDAYRRAAAGATDPVVRRRAASGLTLMMLRIGDFAGARAQAEQLVESGGPDAAGQSLYGDALWAFGLFDEADRAYETALGIDAGNPRAHHGRARALIARNRLDDAFVEVQQALQLAPRDPEFHHTVGVLYERQHRYDEAAAAFGNYVNLLPDRDRSEKALWTRAEIRFLASFKGRIPIDIAPGGADGAIWTVPVRITGDKVMVSVKVNGGAASEFVLDTGAEQTVVSRDIARKRGVLPITYVQTAGVGDVGTRGLQVGRIDLLQVGGLEIRNVPCLIKNPPLSDLPRREPESFSPLALGLSMRIDYARRQLVMGQSLPAVTHATVLPLNMYRLATVRGIVNGQPATFVVDTGGEVISISQATAGRMPPNPYRRIPLKVYGTSGWDKDAFLMPNVDLEFSSLRFPRTPVVVLNLRAPSALLGFQLGGIVGHNFLSKYRVSIDLVRSVLGLDSN